MKLAIVRFINSPAFTATWITAVILLMGAAFYSSFTYERAKKSQLMRYCNLTNGHLYRYKKGSYTSYHTSNIGQSSVMIPVQREVWGDGVRLPDGTEITDDELIRRGIIKPAQQNFRVELK